MNEFTTPSALSPDLLELFAELGIPPDYGREPPRPAYREAQELAEAGPNLLGRVQRLAPRVLTQWEALQDAARNDGVQLVLISGFRSLSYQADLIRNKLAGGQRIEDILQVNAAPGFSQHHTGGALDLATPGSRPLQEEFENSPAFAWLRERAAGFGFSMTYPRGNATGFVYEPWHWALEEWCSACEW